MDERIEGLERHLTGVYANYCRVGHNLLEFVLDFGHRYSDDDAAVYHTRVVMTPTHMRECLLAMNMAMQTYLAEFEAAAQAADRRGDE